MSEKNSPLRTKVLYIRVPQSMHDIIEEIKRELGIDYTTQANMAFLNWFNSNQFKQLTDFANPEDIEIGVTPVEESSLSGLSQRIGGIRQRITSLTSDD